MSGVAEVLRRMDLDDRVSLPAGEVLLTDRKRWSRGRIVGPDVVFLVTIGGETRVYGHVEDAARALEAREHWA